MTPEWRWERAGTEEAAHVAWWMRPGLGEEGGVHAAVVYLVRVGSASERFAWRPFAEIYDEVGLRHYEISERRASELFAVLLRDGVVEQRSDDGAPAWRASQLAIEAIEVAYRNRHPMTE